MTSKSLTNLKKRSRTTKNLKRRIKFLSEDQIVSLYSRINSIPKGCWIWNGYVGKDGYGAVSFNGRKYKVHRLSYHICNSNLNKNLHVLHTCDTPLCINPYHLYQGTDKDNARDRKLRGRGSIPKGIKNPRAILNDSKVRTAIRMRRSGYTVRYLANKFGVNIQAIYNATNGRTWTHV